jgi:hypothetical protein
MSDEHESWADRHEGQINALGHLVAIQQRARLQEQQREQAAAQAAAQQKQIAALKEQTKAIDRQNQIESERARTENARLNIEQQRLKDDQADREARKRQIEHVRELRNLMAEASVSLARVRKKLTA